MSVRFPKSPQTPPRLLTQSAPLSTLAPVKVRFRPETESQLQELANKTGRAPNDLIEDAMAGYLEEPSHLRSTLDSRYDDLKSVRVKAVDGEQAFAELRRKSEKRRARP
jgi:predicted transcriptional regulator